MTLTLRSAADDAARATKSKSEAQSTRITILLFTRKGLRWTVCAGLLALRVRMVNSTQQSALSIQPMRALARAHPRFFAGGLPGIAPSDRLRFSRLQLRGSAGIAPASLSLPSGKDAQTERTFQRTTNAGVRNLPGRLLISQIPENQP